MTDSHSKQQETLIHRELGHMDRQPSTRSVCGLPRIVSPRTRLLGGVIQDTCLRRARFGIYFQIRMRVRHRWFRRRLRQRFLLSEPALPSGPQ